MRQGSAVREVVLDRDVRAPEMLSASTASPGYLVRRYASITGMMIIDVVAQTRVLRGPSERLGGLEWRHL